MELHHQIAQSLNRERLQIHICLSLANITADAASKTQHTVCPVQPSLSCEVSGIALAQQSETGQLYMTAAFAAQAGANTNCSMRTYRQGLSHLPSTLSES